MGFEYFKGKNWIDISREERLYCAHLYFQIRGKELQFVMWLNENKEMDLPTNCEWEVGYEVCFYRDYFNRFRKDSIKDNPQYSQKRTFDLCLFSETDIVIIEAKVKENFKQNQLDDIKNDKILIKILIGDKMNVKIVLLAQSKYISVKGFLKNETNRKNFANKITWREIYELYYNDIFRQADLIK